MLSSELRLSRIGFKRWRMSWRSAGCWSATASLSTATTSRQCLLCSIQRQDHDRWVVGHRGSRAGAPDRRGPDPSELPPFLRTQPRALRDRGGRRHRRRIRLLPGLPPLGSRVRDRANLGELVATRAPGRRLGDRRAGDGPGWRRRDHLRRRPKGDLGHDQRDRVGSSPDDGATTAESPPRSSARAQLEPDLLAQRPSVR